MKLKFLAPLLLVLPVEAFADINMRDASFHQTEQDFSNSLLTRTYSSRSLWKGTFGFGWCAEFEKTFRVQNSTSGILSECDRTSTVPFLINLSGERKVHLRNGTQLTFNPQGQLIEHTSPQKIVSKIKYDTRERLERIETKSKSFVLSYDQKTQRLTEIQAGKNPIIQYQFSNDNLISVKLSKKIQKLYQYDQSHNLVEIKYGKSTEKISYNSQTDEVSVYESPKGCKEFYQFERLNDLEYKSWATRKCPKAPPVGRIFSFKSQRTPQGSLILTEVRSSGGIYDKGVLP